MIKLFICIFVSFLIYLLPHELNYKAWGLFSIFVGTILGLIIRPYPMGSVALISLCFALFFNILDIKTEALYGFSTPVIWLIVMVFFIARGLIKTNLAHRIAYYFIYILGKKTLTLGYGIAISEFFISPVIPSNAARAGGIIMPIVKSMCEVLKSTPKDNTQYKAGEYLMNVGFHTNVITSAIFLTSSAVNPLAQQFAGEMGIEITWLLWAKAAIIPGILSLLVMPFILYFLMRPKFKALNGANEFAYKKLNELGKISKQEIYMLCIFGLMLFLWIFGKSINIAPSSVALLGISLCFLTKILTLDDILNEKEAWHMFIWLSILITFSKYLQVFGFVDWFSSNLSELIKSLSGMKVLFVMGSIYYYIHYMFAGNNSQINAMYVAFVSVCIILGAPSLLTALVFGFLSSLYSSMTHYGSAGGAVYFSQRYITVKRWWLFGFIMSVVNLSIWLGVGSIWWKIIGLY